MNLYIVALFLSVSVADLPLCFGSGTSLQSDSVRPLRPGEYLGEGIRHGRRKRIRTGLERGEKRRHRHKGNPARRYLEKQFLVYNRTIALLGDEVERILQSSKEFPVATLDQTKLALSNQNTSHTSREITPGKAGGRRPHTGSNVELPKNYNPNNQSWKSERETDLMGQKNYNLDVPSPPSEEELQIGFGIALQHLFNIISNVSTHRTAGNSPCEQWVDCRETLQEIFLGPLPSCPCNYPSGIFYDNKIWDNTHQRYFRWKDASGENERLDVYKPSAEYCIRSLLVHRTTTLSAQHCCYDRQRKLITRGYGAGNPNYVSPDVSAVLHYRLDILPWRICKGDFTKYNKVRPPNNGNICKENPDDQEYKRQVERTTTF